MNLHPGILPAALDLGAATLLVGYVIRRSDKTAVHWLLLCTGAGLMIWTTGLLFRFSATSREDLSAALDLVFAGILLVTPVWLLLAGFYARSRFVVERRAPAVAVMVPSGLAFVALLTNDGHRLFIAQTSFEALERGPAVFGGPLFWLFIVWAYVCMLGAAAIYLGAARRMVANADRRRGLVLAVAALTPVISCTLSTLRLLPVTFDLTPSGIAVTLVLLCVAIFRYQLLESVPMARRDVIEHLHVGVLLARTSGEVTDLNPCAERLMGCSTEALRGAPLSQTLLEWTASAERPALSEAIRAMQQRGSPLAVEVRTSDERRIEISGGVVAGGGSEPAGHFIVLRDRTSERRYERIARQNQKLETVATLAAGVVHGVERPLGHLRTNLTRLMRMGERVESDAPGPDAKLAADLADLRQVAVEALDGVERIGRIIADMRPLSAERRKVQLDVDLNQVVRDSLRLARIGSDPRIVVSTELEEPLPLVRASPRRLVQVLVNLLVNARQALSDTEQPCIRVETRLDGDWVEVGVRDNGPGIPEHSQERIFDPFFTTKGPDQGTGLGLAVAFDIVRDHGGSLEERSRPGEGAHFVLRIPTRGRESRR